MVGVHKKKFDFIFIILSTIKTILKYIQIDKRIDLQK